MSLISADNAAALDELFKAASKATTEELLNKTLKSEDGEKADPMSALMISMSAMVGVGIFRENLRKALLGELNHALTKDAVK